MASPVLGKWEPTCDQFLGKVQVPSPVFVSPEQSVMMVGALLAFRDVNCAILMEGGKMKHAIYGYQIVNFLLEAKLEELYRRLYEPVVKAREIAPGSPLPELKLKDSCRKALGEIVAARFGNLLFQDEEGRPVGLLSLVTMLQALEGQTRNLGLSLLEVSSPLTIASSGQSISEVFRFMMRNRVRRVVTKQGRRFYGCTEREILKALFSMKGLESLRDDGTAFLNRPIGDLAQQVYRSVPTVDGDMDVAGAWTAAVENDASALIVDGDRIATPWDLVVKPFLAGKIPF